MYPEKLLGLRTPTDVSRSLPLLKSGQGQYVIPATLHLAHHEEDGPCVDDVCCEQVRKCVSILLCRGNGNRSITMQQDQGAGIGVRGAPTH